MNLVIFLALLVTVLGKSYPLYYITDPEVMKAFNEGWLATASLDELRKIELDWNVWNEVVDDKLSQATGLKRYLQTKSGTLNQIAAKVNLIDSKTVEWISDQQVSREYSTYDLLALYAQNAASWFQENEELECAVGVNANVIGDSINFTVWTIIGTNGHCALDFASAAQALVGANSTYPPSGSGWKSIVW